MYLSEQYVTYQLAYNLSNNEGYDVLHLNENKEEVWLEKYENNTSKIIRILHQGFDWKNYLKKDIAQVFQQTKAMKQLFLGKNIEVYNVYISSHTPIDDWDILKKPLQLNEKNTPKMQVYYITNDNLEEELSRLRLDAGTDIDVSNEAQSEAEKEIAVDTYRNRLSDMLYTKNKQVKDLFSFGKPFFTYILMVINIIMFALLEFKGGSTNIDTLIKLGAKYNPAMMEGEWWRLISSMFLHIGFLHLAMNMLALYYLGTVVERIFGSKRFLVIYFMSGIAGSLTSFAFAMNVSAGASGAIFGLFGALLFFGTIHKKVFFQTMGRNIITIVSINIVLGFAVPQIDMGAHLGGLIAGFIASAIVHLPRLKKITVQFIALIIYILMLSSLLIFGLRSTTNAITYQLIKIEEHIQEEDYEAVVTQTTNALENPGQFAAELLFQRSVAYIELNKNELAITDLEESIAFKEDFPEVYHNLAILYHASGLQEKAEEMAEKAYHLKPDDTEYQKLFEQIKRN